MRLTIDWGDGSPSVVLDSDPSDAAEAMGTYDLLSDWVRLLQVGSAADLAHTYPLPGDYTITLAMVSYVQPSQPVTATQQLLVTVTTGPPPPPNVPRSLLVGTGVASYAFGDPVFIGEGTGAALALDGPA